MKDFPFQPLFGGKEAPDKNEEMAKAFEKLRAKGSESLKNKIPPKRTIPKTSVVPPRQHKSKHIAGIIPPTKANLAGIGSLLGNKRVVVFVLVIILILFIVALLLHRQSQQQDKIKLLTKQFKKLKRLK